MGKIQDIGQGMQEAAESSLRAVCFSWLRAGGLQWCGLGAA